MQKITPFLWFDTQAEDAMNYYVSIFKDSRINSVSRYTAEGPGPAGSVMTASFTLNGQEFTALNGGPAFKFTEAVSFVIHCSTQEEVDHYWERLSADGAEMACGWVKDKFGLSWQVVPVQLMQLLGDKDKAKVQRVMHEMMQMKKLDIAKLEAAAGEITS